MDKSREQFLEWFSREHEEVENSNELAAKVMKMIAWSSWQASRAAVEIELPPTTEVHPLGPSAAKVFCELHKNTVAECAKAIRADGLKVKGE
ncbi:TPA: hypothetical protein JJI82_16215 [Cronobacter sakazakii]|nr:hypothetical protein [Cronobacter sakazakii]